MNAVKSADVAVIVTEWDEFRALDLPRMRDLMACPVVVDLRNVYRSEEMKKHGFAYTCVGRAAASRATGQMPPMRTEVLAQALSGDAK